MTKKALISKNQFEGPTKTEGYRVAQVADAEFEVNTTNLMWVDCNDEVEADSWWYRISDGAIKKKEDLVERPTDPVDADGNPTAYHQWNWDTESWDQIDLD